MGYTNYWEGKPSKEQLENIAFGFKKLLQSLPPLAGGNGKGKPVVRKDRICFNGLVAEGQDHETFELVEKGIDVAFGGIAFDSFCKTARKRYDIAVKCALLLYHFHTGNSVTCDDGGPLAKGEGNEGGGDNWQAARDLILKVLGIEVVVAMELVG